MRRLFNRGHYRYDHVTVPGGPMTVGRKGKNGSCWGLDRLDTGLHPWPSNLGQAANYYSHEIKGPGRRAPRPRLWYFGALPYSPLSA